MTHPVANFLAFQLCWFSNVFGAARGWVWLGPTVALVWIAIHIGWQRPFPRAEVALLLTAGVIGYSADSLLVLSGLLAFPESSRLGGPSPMWMVCLWIGFGATFAHSLNWLRRRLVLAVALGAIAGPLAYLAGQSIGALSLTSRESLIAVGIQYAIATPLLFKLLGVAERLWQPHHVSTEGQQ